jgi:hypothetical protein
MSSPNLPATIPNLPTVKSQDQLKQALQLFDSAKFNVLVPAAMNFSSPLHKVAFEIVFINPEVDAKNNGPDIYSTDGGKTFTFHAKAANKIAGSAGINWNDSKADEVQYDSNGRVNTVQHQVAWSIKRPNGTTRSGTTTGYYNHDEDKARFGKDQTESRRHFALQLAESNAKYRAIFDALEMLPRQLKREDFARPFVVPCVIEDISDMIKDDPEMKRMVVAHSLGITEQVYGPQSQQRETKTDPNLISGVRAEVVDDNSQGVKVGPGGEMILDLKTEAGYKQSWTLKSTDERDAELKRLLKEKGVEFPAGTIFGEMAIARQVDALWYYNTLPAPEKKASLPWEKGGQASA